MAESLILNAPIVKTLVSFRVDRIDLDFDGSAIAIRIAGTDGTIQTIAYEGGTARALMNTLNSGSGPPGRSIHRRILERLVADGKVPAGVVTGTPDP
jgi:hypothetical protein